MKTFRVFCTDRDATDSSSSEEDEKIPENPSENKRFSREITIGEGHAPPESTLFPSLETSGKAEKKYPGVRKRKSGKYAAEIRHPIEKKGVWLGTFNTAKEAYDVYYKKKLEFAALRNVTNCGSNSVELKSNGENGDQKEMLIESSRVRSKWNWGENGDGKMGEKEGEMEVPKGVIRVKSGKWGVMINHPKTEAKVWLGSFDSVEEAVRVYKKKKSEFAERLVVKEKKLSDILSGDDACDGGDVKRRKVVLGGGKEGGRLSPKLKNRVSSKKKKKGSKKISFKERVERINRLQKLQYGCGDLLKKNGVGNSSKKDEVKKGESTNSDFVKAIDDSKGEATKEKTSNLKFSEVINLEETAVELPPGVRITKGGRFGAWITHPVSGKEFWLRSFDTIEKAVEGIKKKMAEFEKSLKSKKAQCDAIYGSPTSVLEAENEISETSSIKVKNEPIPESFTSVLEEGRVKNGDLNLPLTFDEAVKLGFMNEYGQLLGEYCECDESMWLINRDIN